MINRDLKIISWTCIIDEIQESKFHGIQYSIIHIDHKKNYNIWYILYDLE